MRELFSRILRRLPVLLPLLTITTACFMKAVEVGGLGSLPWIVFAISSIVLASFACAWPLAEFFAIPFGRIYFPHVEGTPEPNYPLAEWYLEQHRFEDAFHEYDKILRYHPRETTARCLHIELLLAKLNDERAARRSLRRGLRLAPDEECRERLSEAFAETMRRVEREEQPPRSTEDVAL